MDGRGLTWNGAVNGPARLLNVESLCAVARRRTGLKDFGKPPLNPALSVLVDSLNFEAGLHSLGRFLMRLHLRNLLETRLPLNSLWNGTRAKLQSGPIPTPVFITGTPRSGSTFLHELLGEDGQNRAPRVWEVMYPVRAPKFSSRKRSMAVWQAAACLWWFRRLAPGADAVYPMRARSPHECVAIHSFTFQSEEFVSTCRVPSYERFLRSSDLTKAYEWEKIFLNHLETSIPSRQWILKAPDHVYGLEQLFSVFPDAIIVHTHRDPLEVLRSSSQLSRVLYRLYGRSPALNEIGQREASKLCDAVDRFMNFRDQHPNLSDRFIDVTYKELVTDPLTVVQKIYLRLGRPLTADAASGMRALVAKRSRYHGSHSLPTLSQLGLEPAAQSKRFESYCARFGIERQTNSLQ